MALLVLENLRAGGQILVSATLPAQQLLKKLTPDEASLLVNYQIQELNRIYLPLWEIAQIALALALIAVLFFIDLKRRVMPLVFAGSMFVIVLFQHFALSPELTYRGRDADFPPGNRTFGVQARLWTMQQAYLGTEFVKLLMGGVLVSYLFVFHVETTRRRRKVDSIDHAHHSHIDR
jgi:hypothetical protein